MPEGAPPAAGTPHPSTGTPAERLARDRGRIAAAAIALVVIGGVVAAVLYDGAVATSGTRLTLHDVVNRGTSDTGPARGGTL